MATFHTLIVVPFREMVLMVASYIPTLLTAVFVLIVGLITAKIIYEVLHRLFKEVHLDKIADKAGFSGVLHKGGIKYSLSHLLVGVINLVVMVIFMIMMLGMLGVHTTSALLSTIVTYLPSVISAAFVTVLGLVFAKIVSKTIYAVVSIIGLPSPKLHERISRWAIIIFTMKVALEELGYGMLFVGPTFYIWFGGLVLALALSFGLGGKDKAASYLNKKDKEYTPKNGKHVRGFHFTGR